ncbi:MAG TPA: hypothetical protein VF547_06215 [Allosphingosinicella sp.]|jgi:hypothetical protein
MNLPFVRPDVRTFLDYYNALPALPKSQGGTPPTLVQAAGLDPRRAKPSSADDIGAGVDASKLILAEARTA